MSMYNKLNNLEILFILGIAVVVNRETIVFFKKQKL
jgi:hypothetical protein